PVHGISAALLPYNASGSIAEEEFARHLTATKAAGLTTAVNMDTGYVNLLTPEERERVLRIAREALGAGVEFVAGAYVEGQDGDVVALYRREIARIRSYGGTPILFQTACTHGLPSAEKVAVYREACRDMGPVLGFELGQMFAPNGEIWNEETFGRILEIPE